MEKWLLQFTDLINKIPSWVWIWLILCANFLSFIPHSNEEQQFAAAKQFFDPNWLPYSFAFNEWAGTRIIYQYIVGFCLEYLSFEQMTFWGRLFNFLLFAFPLSRIFKSFQLNNVYILLILQVLFVPYQAFYGGEWIFKGFEVKTLAYIFILYAFSCILDKKLLKAFVLSAIASYLHILAGLSFAAALTIYLLISQKSIVKAIKYGGIYIAIMLPFIVYLSSHIFNSPSVIDGVNINWIYTYYRAPHHCAPFASYALFKYNFLSGILISIAVLLTAILLKKSNITSAENTGFDFVIACIIILMTGMLIAAIDKNGFLLKFYPFRIAAIATLVMFISIVSFAKNNIISNKTQLISGIVLLFSTTFLIRSGWETIDVLRTKNDYYNELLAKWAKNKTQQDDIFFFVDAKNNNALTFSRKAERSRFVIEKVMPTEGNKIYEWYRRMELKNKCSDNIDNVQEELNSNRINYIVLNKKEIERNWLKKVYENDIYTVYRIIN